MRRVLLLILCVLLLCMPVLGVETEGQDESQNVDESQTTEASETAEATAPPETVPPATQPPMENSAGVIRSYEASFTVNAQGTAQVSATILLHLTESTDKLVIPLGRGASNCYVNGTRLSVRKVNGVPAATLKNPGGLLGDFQIQLTYQLSRCVNGDGLLELPLLPGGYAYPLEKLSFQVTLPGTVEERAGFSSGYLGEDIENYLKLTQEETVLSGTLLNTMRDHDSLNLTLQTPETLFHRTTQGGGSDKTVRLIMLALLGLMLLYWALRLSWKPVRVGYQSHPPLGETAGETEALITGGNLRFSLIVLTWAQMGYLTIRRGRDVTLHRRMDMGNERSPMEIQAFQRLFRRGSRISVSSRDYVRLRRDMDGRRPKIQDQFVKGSGNPGILRILGQVLGFAAGIGIGDGLLPPMNVRFLPLIPCGILGLWLSRLVLRGSTALWGREKKKAVWGTLAFLVGILLGALGNRLNLGLLWALGEVLAGGLTMFGGRRTENGRRILQGELGLNRFFRWESREQHRSAQEGNPSYYYDLAPYALALGADRAFARKFQKISLPSCGYLKCNLKDRKAETWRKALRETVDLMDGRPVGLERYFLGRLLLAAAAERQRKRRPQRRRAPAGGSRRR